jgi:hypothetical protein
VFHKQKQKPDLVDYQRVTFQKPFSQRERTPLENDPGGGRRKLRQKNSAGRLKKY